MNVSLRSTTADANTSHVGQEQLETPLQKSRRTIQDALTLLTNLDTTTSLRGNVKVSLAVTNLFELTALHGLTPHQLNDLVDIIHCDNPKITQGIRCKLVKCLVPSTTMPQDVVVRLIYKITTGVYSGSSNLHVLMLRWVLVVFDHLDGYDRLHKLYNLIFTFINSNKLLPFACQLLFLLTRKKDVAFWRVQRLLEMVKMLGPEPCIMGLLMVYKVYCPHLVTTQLRYGSQAFFKNVDAKLRAMVDYVTSQNLQQTEEEGQHDTVNVAKKRRSWISQKRTTKSQKMCIPEVHAAMEEIEEEEDIPVETISASQRRTNIPYTQIDSSASFLKNIDRIDYPSQVSAVLQDSRLQLLMSLDPDPVVMTRLSLWIQHMFAFGFEKTGPKSEAESNQKEEFLKMLLQFTQRVQWLPVVESFLAKHLPLWDGIEHAPVIFQFVSEISFDIEQSVFDKNILQSLLHLFYSSDVYFKVGFTASMTKLLHNWGRKYLLTVRRRTSSDDDLSTSQTELDTLSNIETKVMKLVKAMDTALVVGLRMEGDNLLLQRVAVDFIETVSAMYPTCSVPLIIFPTHVFYRLLVSDCPDVVASLCGCINSFRTSITTARDKGQVYRMYDTVTTWPGMVVDRTLATTLNSSASQSNLGTTTALDVSLVTGANKRGLNAFNSVLLDVMDILWRGRLFTQRKRFPSYMSMDIRLPQSVATSLDPQSLALDRSPVLLGLAYKFHTEVRGEDKRFHPEHIEKYKDVYLQFLDREGFPQFKELVNMNLKGRKNSHSVLSERN